MVCTYDPRFQRYDCKSPTAICKQLNLYENPIITDDGEEVYFSINEIENHYSERETEYSSLWKSIGDCFSDTIAHDPSLSEEDEVLLAEFIANLFVRNPYIIEQVEKQEVTEKAVNADKLQSIKTVLKKEYNVDLASALRISYKYEWLDERIKGSYPQMVKASLLKLERVFYVSRGRHFITSNIPVSVKVQNNGELAMLMVPLSPNCLLAYNCRRFGKTITYLPAFAVDALNEVYTSGRLSAVRYIYGREKSDIEYYYKVG